MSKHPTYQKLFQELRRQDKLAAIGGILSWDHQVNLPRGSAEFRAETSAVYSELVHRESTRAEIGEWLAELAEATDLSDDERCVVADAAKDYALKTKLPADFVNRRSKAQNEGYHAWVDARAQNDFAAYAPHLEKHIALCREMAGYMGREADAYDFFVDLYDPGMNCEKIDKLFTPLKAELVPLVESIVNSPVKPDMTFLKGFPEDKQEIFLNEVVLALGLDMSRAKMTDRFTPSAADTPAIPD